MTAFIQTLNEGKQDAMTMARASLEIFAAEKSRVSAQQVIEMDAYRQEIEDRVASQPQSLVV